MKKETNIIALTGFILGIFNILTLCCCAPVFGVAGLICSIIGYTDCKEDKYEKNYRSYAIAGIWLNAISIFMSIVMAVLQMVFGFISALLSV